MFKPSAFTVTFLACALLSSGLWAQTTRPTSRPTSRPANQQANQQGNKQVKKQAKKMDRRAMRAARSFKRLQVPGEQVASNVARLKRELRWHKNLGSALEAGRDSKKPVLWIQALGDLDGFL